MPDEYWLDECDCGAELRVPLHFDGGIRCPKCGLLAVCKDGEIEYYEDDGQCET